MEDILRQGTGVASVELTVRLAAGAGLESAWARAERLLLEQPRVARVSREGESLRVELELESGGGVGQADAAAAALLAVLVTAGLPVCFFGTRERNLEDAFMTVTKGRLA